MAKTENVRKKNRKLISALQWLIKGVNNPKALQTKIGH